MVWRIRLVAALLPFWLTGMSWAADDDKVQCDFAAAQKVSFPMIGDADRKIIDLYDAAWPIFRLAQRVTFGANVSAVSGNPVGESGSGKPAFGYALM